MLNHSIRHPLRIDTLNGIRNSHNLRRSQATCQVILLIIRRPKIRQQVVTQSVRRRRERVCKLNTRVGVIEDTSWEGNGCR